MKSETWSFPLVTFGSIEGEHHTSAVLEIGEDGEWDQLYIVNPQASLLFLLHVHCT